MSNRKTWHDTSYGILPSSNLNQQLYQDSSVGGPNNQEKKNTNYKKKVPNHLANAPLNVYKSVITEQILPLNVLEKMMSDARDAVVNRLIESFSASSVLPTGTEPRRMVPELIE